MPRCKVCNHPNRKEIDQALLNGASVRDVGSMYGLDKSAVSRHQANGHIISALVKGHTAQEVARADSILGEVVSLKERGLILLDQAEGDGDIRTAAICLREVRSVLELLAKVTGEISKTTQTVNNTTVFNAPVFIEFQTVIMKALEPYPEARIAVAQALEGVTIE